MTQTTLVLTEGSQDLMRGMLKREEEHSAIGYVSEGEWLDWAGQIDALRAEVGLPLVERAVVRPDGTPDRVPMTYRNHIRLHLEETLP
jgi:hypothetical protein